ncbi:hypothetical protein H5V45_14860 [Nocardioides sp. KIGAM211]|uniref:Uncharacterized protein n=1 Tax=Nocardioides luti TaxID=2761101 RepID=A0A7X0VBC0_9ACTN|nr:choice-of-anchor P family protein [Nocardioides luti]MBB6628604.1 hypothetical protein [Nocardioides luti]
MTSTRTTSQRFVRSLAATAVVGVMLPVAAAAPARAEGGGDAPYAGFSTEAVATPVKIEVYEPTIPVPATPQAELSLGYSKVAADTGSSAGRASYLWPGDAVGEGFKTIVENLGLPQEVSGPLAEGGYPFQVNSTYPSGENSQADEPFPGMVMRTSSGERTTSAQTGYSTNCQVDDGGSGSGDGGGGTPGVPGLPPLPGLPGLPGAGRSGGSSAADAAAALLGGGTTSASGKHSGKSAQEEKASCQLPAELAALVDFGGYASTSTSTNTGSKVGATSKAHLADIDLLGGVITISDVHAQALTTSNGHRTKPSGGSGYGTLAIAGQEFTIGPDGIHAAGQSQPIPGLPDDPAKALEQLGITITVPKPAYERDGDQATSQVAALVVQLDTKQLRSKLDGVPFDEIVGAVPDEAGQLKSLLGALVHLSPRFVVTLGDVTSLVDTVQALETTPPSTPDDPASTNPSGGDGAGGSTTGGATAPSAGAPAAPGGDAPAGDGADGDLTDAAPAAAGLPPLFSIPGVLLVGGIALAAVGGSYFRKIGALALGGTGACPHGLDSGLPDLRKA